MQARELTQTDQREVPYSVVPCSAYKLREKMLRVMVFVFQESGICDEICFPGSGRTSACLWDAADEFLLFFCLHMRLFIWQTVYLCPQVLTPSHSQFFSLTLPGGWLSSCRVLKCLPGSTTGGSSYYYYCYYYNNNNNKKTSITNSLCFWVNMYWPVVV